jgi:hypothetical protein
VIPTARKLLADAKRVGIILSANGGRLAFDAPAGAMTPDLRARLPRQADQGPSGC